jgi:cytochrome c
MKALSAVVLAAAVLMSGSVLASADLAKKNGCVACHDAAVKKIGPTWKDIAAKNKADKDAENTLIAAIAKGGKDKYGKIPMPPQPKAAGDAAALAKWIMTH